MDAYGCIVREVPMFTGLHGLGETPEETTMAVVGVVVMAALRRAKRKREQLAT